MYHKTSEIFEFNKMIFIYLSTVNILFLWLIKMIIHKKILIKKTFLDIPILLFLFSQLLSTFFSIDQHTSIFGYYGRFNGGLLSIISYLILYYAFVSNIKTESAFKYLLKLLRISLFSSSIITLWGLPGRFGYDLTCYLFTGILTNGCWTEQFKPHERMFSTLGQPNWLGAYLAINFFISLFFLLREFEKKFFFNKLLNFSISFLLFTGILLTRSRSAYLALIITFILFVMINYLIVLKKSWFKKNLYLIFLIITPILIFKTGVSQIDKFLNPTFYLKKLSFLYYLFENKYQKNKKEPSVSSNNSSTFSTDITESGEIRKIVWQGAINLGFKYPFFGTGVETFAYSYYFVRPKEHNLTSEWDFIYNKAHNEYLNYFATTGFIGLSAYLLMIFFFIFYFLKSLLRVKSQSIDKNQSNNSFFVSLVEKNLDKFNINDFNLLIICLFLSYITILITNFFGFSTTTVNLFFYLIPAMLITIFLKKERNINILKDKKNQDKKSFNVYLPQKIFIFFITILYFYSLSFILFYYLADINYALADNLYKIEEFPASYHYIQKAIQYKNDEHIYYDKLSMISANIGVLYILNKTTDPQLFKKASDFIDLSIKSNFLAINSSSKNIIYWKTKAKINYLFYQVKKNKDYLEETKKSFKKCFELAPTDPKIYYSLAAIYYNETDQIDKAFDLVNRAIDLKPNYRDGYYLRGLIFTKLGKKDEAKKNFEIIIKKINPNDIEVLNKIKEL